METLTTTLALKEWDAVVAALETGRQALLVRKGGLDDPDGRLDVPAGPFWLYPTLFHERGVFLKPEHHAMLVPGMHRRPRSEVSGVPRPDGHARAVTAGHVAIRALAEVAAAVRATSLDALRALVPRTVWTEKYAALRFRWRPEERPLVLVLRVRILPQAVEIEELDEYGGCRSWLRLRTAPDPDDARPVWPEARLAEEVAAVRRLLGAR